MGISKSQDIVPGGARDGGQKSDGGRHRLTTQRVSFVGVNSHGIDNFSDKNDTVFWRWRWYDLWKRRID